MFKGTVRENLHVAGDNITEDEMITALEKVNLFGFLQKQNGLDTQILEKGSNFSTGQCQRLALARAILKNSHIYIFDEATSNIDTESENMIMNTIHKLAKEKTVILISHRLANVVNSDKIYFLKEGEIIEEGKHSELMDIDGEYRRLFESQKELEEYGKVVEDE